MSMDMTELGMLTDGEIFAVKRRRAGVTQESIAAAAGLSRGYVSLYELGRVEPPVRTREAFWEALKELSPGEPTAAA